MANVTLKNVKKIYPHSSEQKKKKSKKKDETPMFSYDEELQKEAQAAEAAEQEA